MRAVTDQPASRRIEREKRTIAAMVGLYCADLHGSHGEPCEPCSALRAYALERLRRCPFGAGKTTCARCPVHCYKPDMREQVRAVMRYAGPRMLLRHPILAALHEWDDLRSQLRSRPAANGSRRGRG